MDVIDPYVGYALRTTYQDLPARVTECTKQHILHTVGTVIGGSSSAGCKQVVDVVTKWSGSEKSRILVYGGKAPAAAAALANGVMAHALDFCANDYRTHYKSSVAAVPACLSVADLKGGVTGKEFLTAVYLGVDLGIRIALAVNPKPCHTSYWMIGGFASAVGAGKILGLNEEQMLDALGIAYCEVSPSGVGTSSPTLTKRLKAGLAASAGVFSALLAKEGFQGGRNVFQGPRGFFCTYWGVEGDLEELSADLGTRFEIVNVGLKAYPCCGALQAPIDASLRLVGEHDIRADEVEAVHVYLSKHSSPIETLEGDPQALARTRHPKGVVDAQFSVPWGVATAIVRRKVTLEDFTEDAIRNSEVLNLASKVTYVGDPQLSLVDETLSPAAVQIRTRSGQVFSARVDFPKGHPRNPVTMGETAGAFRKCAAHAARPLPEEKVEKAVAMIAKLEELDDVSRLTELIVA